MNRFLLCTIVVFLFSNSTHKKPEDKDIIELPIEIVTGYGPFDKYANRVDWSTDEPGSIWALKEGEVSGIPTGWNELVVKKMWFDIQQYAYQNFKQGNFGEEDFYYLANSWGMELESEHYSADPIKCYTHIALGKTNEGTIVYKIDTDNDNDLSDEVESKPFTNVSWENLDALSQQAHQVSTEIMRNGKSTYVKIPVLIWENESGELLRNFPFYARAKYKDTELSVGSSFCHTAFYYQSSLCVTPSNNQMASNIVDLNQLIEIEGERFINLGVNMKKGSLSLQRIDPNTKFYSNQIGTYAREFSGSDFLTKKSIDLGDYTGKYVLLDFWGTWCGPCIRELPNFKNAYANTNREQIEFVSIVYDRPESLEKYLNKDRLSWPQILSTEDNNIVDTYGVEAFPTTFLIDPEGKIIAKNLRGESLLNDLNQIIQ